MTELRPAARTAALWASVALALAACGGGGGAPPPAPVPPPVGAPPPAAPPPPPPVSFTLSGTIAVAENAAVDSDTNDPNQADYQVNDTAAAAQPITSPLLLVGTVNLPGTGPAGTNFSIGDTDDVFKVSLTAGQVVELEFAADSTQADIDLQLISEDGLDGGISEGTASRFECIEVAASKTYYVFAYAFSNASIYNLRIGAPGTAGSCGQRTAPLRFDPQQLLALPKPAGRDPREAAAVLERKAGIRTFASGSGMQLLRLPAAARERAQGLNALAAARASGAGPSRSAARTSPAPSASMQALPPALSTLRYAKHLRASGDYVYVQPNWIEQRHALFGAFPPDDRGYSYQRWHYEQINLPAAMSRITALAAQPVQRPIVAVIDDGVVLDHPDLAPQLFSAGRTFLTRNVPGDGNLASGDNPAGATDNAVFHGTHVAGTAAAATFDGIGGAGVAPMAQILPLRVFSPAGSGASSLDIIQAMLYAAGLANNSGSLPARRADVINLSLGGDRSCDPAYQVAIDQVRAAGVIVVAAAGNSGRNDIGRRVPVASPANCNGTIAVSATDARKAVTSYSNTGDATVVAAPGGDMRQSTTGTGAPDGIYSALATFDAAGQRRASFGPNMGTSMAAPHVAGVMALMRYVNPALTVAQIDALIADGRLTDDAGSPGRDIDYGFGLINARKAVDAALEVAGGGGPAPAGLVVASPSSLDFGSFQSSATLDLAASGAGAETVVSITGDVPAVTVSAVEGAVDPATGLGRYTIDVDRNALAGSAFPRLTVTLAPSRSFTVQLSVTQPGAGGAVGSGHFGPMYVLLLDPATLDVVTSLQATRNGSVYSWQHSGYALERVIVIAGGDLDNDNLVCQRGEPCGAYPVLQADGNLAVVELSGDRADLDFRAAPLSGISAQAAGRDAAGMRAGGWRRSR